MRGQTPTVVVDVSGLLLGIVHRNSIDFYPH